MMSATKSKVEKRKKDEDVQKSGLRNQGSNFGQSVVKFNLELVNGKRRLHSLRPRLVVSKVSLF
jgi:hypothetical protein